MKLPVSFDQFRKNPITAISFVLIMVVGYLYVDNKMVHSQQLVEHKERIEKLESDEFRLEEKLDKMNEKLLECLGLKNSNINTDGFLWKDTYKRIINRR